MVICVVVLLVDVGWVDSVKVAAAVLVLVLLVVVDNDESDGDGSVVIVPFVVAVADVKLSCLELDDKHVPHVTGHWI